MATRATSVTGPNPARHASTSLSKAVTASIITITFLGSVVVSPLYPLYQEEYRFSDLTLTCIYAVYAAGNVIALLVFGQISDQVGRKRAALTGLTLAAAGGLVFLLAQATAWLFAGRLLVGLAVGICSGTATAWLAEQFGEARRATASLTAATANLTGIALGPLIGGVLAQYAPAPLTSTPAVYVLTVLVVWVAARRVPDTDQPRPVSLRALRVRPRIGVPRELWSSFATPAATAFVVFAVGGLYFALIPGIMIRDLHQTNLAVGGLIITEFGTFAVAGTLLARRLRSEAAMRAGLVTMLPAALLVVLAQQLASLPLLIAAAAAGGLALSVGYRGSLEVVNRIAPDDRRAEVVSAYFTACFVGNSLPIIGIGAIAAVTNPLIASTTFAAAIAVLALAALRFRPHR